MENCIVTTYTFSNINVENGKEIVYKLVVDIVIPARTYARINHSLVETAVCDNDRLAWPDRISYDQDSDEFEFYGRDYRKHLPDDTLVYVLFKDYDIEIAKLNADKKAVEALKVLYET